jgi:hypothetical protein
VVLAVVGSDRKQLAYLYFVWHLEVLEDILKSRWYLSEIDAFFQLDIRFRLLLEQREESEIRC